MMLSYDCVQSLSFNNYSEMKDILGKIDYSFLYSQYRKKFDKWIKHASNNEIKNEIKVIKKILYPSTSNIGLIRSLLRKKIDSSYIGIYFKLHTYLNRYVQSIPI